MIHWSDWLRLPFNMAIHIELHFVNFCPIIVSRWTSFLTTTTTNVLNELLKSHRVKASSLTVLLNLKRSASKHRWRESSAWYSRRKAWAQPLKELVDVSLQIRGEADPQLRTTGVSTFITMSMWVTVGRLPGIQQQRTQRVVKYTIYDTSKIFNDTVVRVLA